MAQVLIIGASRGIGREAVKAALAKGHRVRAFARSAEDLEIDDPMLERFPGDALSPEDVTRALQGMDVVILALGIRESIAMLWQKVTLFSEATTVLIGAMQAQGPDRLICVTGIGAGDSLSALSSLERLGHRAILGEPYKDKTRQEALVRASGLRWTLVRPTILTNNRGTGRYRVFMRPEEWRMGIIPRADVAHYLMRCIDDEATIGTAPVLAR